jgi:branched-chain amino acid transport system substrate-binding protein
VSSRRTAEKSWARYGIRSTPQICPFPAAGPGFEGQDHRPGERRRDLQNTVKQASEFGITKGGQSLAALAIEITDVHALGLEKAQGLYLTTGFYWDLNDETRKWSQRFFERHKKMPTMSQVGVYSSLMHYFKAVQAAGTDEAPTVMAKMRATPVNDFFAKSGKLREDGLMVMTCTSPG